MSRPPRSRTAGVIDRVLLIRAWGLLGIVSTVLVMGGFFYTLSHAGWHYGDPTKVGATLHHAYHRVMVEPAAAMGHRLRTRIRRSGCLCPAAATHLRHRITSARSARDRVALPAHRVGQRRNRPLDRAPSSLTRMLSKASSVRRYRSFRGLLAELASSRRRGM